MAVLSCKSNKSFPSREILAQTMVLAPSQTMARFYPTIHSKVGCSHPPQPKVRWEISTHHSPQADSPVPPQKMGRCVCVCVKLCGCAGEGGGVIIFEGQNSWSVWVWCVGGVVRGEGVRECSLHPKKSMTTHHTALQFTHSHAHSPPRSPIHPSHLPSHSPAHTSHQHTTQHKRNGKF